MEASIIRAYDALGEAISYLEDALSADIPKQVASRLLQELTNARNMRERLRHLAGLHSPVLIGYLDLPLYEDAASTTPA